MAKSGLPAAARLLSHEMTGSAMTTPQPVIVIGAQVCVVPCVVSGMIRISKAVVIDGKSG
jgi:hypothetical protein